MHMAHKSTSFADTVTARLNDAKATLAQVEAKARDKGAQAHAAAIKSLNTTRDYIDQKVKDLEKTSEQHRSRAKADIDQDVATFKASVDKFAGTFRR